MKKLVLAAALAAATCCAGFAQDMPMDHGSMKMGKDGKPIPSPRATAMVNLNGTKIDLSYGAPSLRGRKMIGDHDPYGKVWRLGANEATSFVTSGDVMVGSTLVPAGSYTLFVLPTADAWTLIISKKTGEWGIPYPGEQFDLARVSMTKGMLPASQERLSITFENVHPKHADMHVKWAMDDYSVKLSTK